MYDFSSTNLISSVLEKAMQGKYLFDPMHITVQRHRYIDQGKCINSECVHRKSDLKGFGVIEQLSGNLF